jgi:poly(A) polymerase
MGLEMLRETGLLKQFAPELVDMYGVTQNIYHLYDVWTHTMKAIDALPDDADLILRLATLFHDVGKPGTRSVDESGNVHFYTHQALGAEIAKTVLKRLRFPNDIINHVARIVSMHLRVGEYDAVWSDAAVRRLVRDAGDDLEKLITLTCADKAAANLEMPTADVDGLQERIAQVTAHVDVAAIKSPLSGNEIMSVLGIEEGSLVGEVKDFLVNEVIEGRLDMADKTTARQLVRDKWQFHK